MAHSRNVPSSTSLPRKSIRGCALCCKMIREEMVVNDQARVVVAEPAGMTPARPQSQDS